MGTIVNEELEKIVRVLGSELANVIGAKYTFTSSDARGDSIVMGTITGMVYTSFDKKVKFYMSTKKIGKMILDHIEVNGDGKVFAKDSYDGNDQYVGQYYVGTLKIFA